MRKIALYIPSMNGGGAEKVFMILANYFIDQGYQVDLLLTIKVGPYLADLDQRIKIIELSGKRTILDIAKLTNYLKYNQPEVLLSALTHANLIAITSNLLAGRRSNIYLSEHANFTQNLKEVNPFKVRVIKLLIKKLYRYANGVICVSKGVKADFCSNFPFLENKMVVIYNPFQTQLIKNKSQEIIDHNWLMSNREFKTIISAGRLNVAKDFKTLLRAFLIVKNQLNVRLIILGEGELREDLAAFIKENDLADTVNLYGFVDNPFAYISKADTFVLSSKYEGLPNVLVESMVCGVPLVATDCPSGPAEILEDGKWGELVSVGDHEKLAQAIVHTLKTNEQLNYTSRIEDFDYRKIGNEYLECILNE